MKVPSILFALVLSALIFTAGCVTTSEVERRGAALDKLLAEQHEPMYYCAPVHLATAEAELVFARHESSQGRSHTATAYLNTAESNAQVAYDGSRDRRCLGDHDLDGIPDREDLCPDEPEDRDNFKDEDGCPDPDNDLDGILDKADRCPNDKGPISNNGCPILDSDGDGVPDDKDRCPKEYGAPSNQGCPFEDRDKDGVLDQDDQCPDDPGPKANAGCPYKLIQITDNQIILKQKIFFAFAKSKIKSESFPLMNEIVQALNDHKTFQIRIEGHTDDVGNAKSNKKLSSARANAVKKYLIAKGIASSRLQAVGFGEEKPIEDNKTDTGRAVNRRVEFFIVSK